MDDQARRRFVWNWLPVRYAVPECWQSLGAIPRPEAGSRGERALSVWLLRRYELEGRWLRNDLPYAWLLDTQEQLLERAFMVGLASCAGAVSLQLAREDILAFQAVLGREAYSKALYCSDRYPDLAALMPAWDAEVHTRDNLLAQGLALMAALLDTAEDGTRDRFLLRFLLDAQPDIYVDGKVRLEIEALLAEVPLRSDPVFEWSLPQPE